MKICYYDFLNKFISIQAILVRITLSYNCDNFVPKGAEMGICPLWAQNNAARVFDLVTIDHVSIRNNISRNVSPPISSRNLRRATLEIRDRRIISRERNIIVGWRRSCLAEDGRRGIDDSISLIGLWPCISASGFFLDYKALGVLVHKHALARLFERNIQPPEKVAQALLMPRFVKALLSMAKDEEKLGFEFPFQQGKFVGSLEWVRDLNGAMTSTFGIRSWIADPIDSFAWTGKASRTLQKAIDLDHIKRLTDLGQYNNHWNSKF